jgi:hypothetical protein
MPALSSRRRFETNEYAWSDRKMSLLLLLVLLVLLFGGGAFYVTSNALLVVVIVLLVLGVGGYAGRGRFR